MTRRFILVALTTLAIAGASCSGDASPSPAPPKPAPTKRPSVLLVTIDTWRWDHLGVSGQHNVATPALDALAKSGVYVPRVQTTCPMTTPAHASILTGLAPREHGIRDNQHFALAAGVPTLAERFAVSGYATGAIVSGAPLRRAYGLDRGFSSYDDTGLAAEGGNVFTPMSRPARDATDRALGWLGGRDAAAPLFLWVHYYDAHSPYTPPAPYRDTYAAHPYAGEIAYVDAQLGRLLDAVRADRGRAWIVAVTGDHGEGLGDHGEATHGILLYGSTLDVPLIVSGAGVAEAGSPGPGPFDVIDVPATLCGLAGIGPAPGSGLSIFARGTAPRWLAAESAYPALAHGLAPPVLLRRDRLVFLDQGTSEVYDLSADPGETRDLSATPRGRAFVEEASKARSRAFGDRLEDEIAGGSLALGREQLDALKGLGYVSAGAPSHRAYRRTDLRGFASALSKLQSARDLLSAHRFPEALAGYDSFLATYPESALAHQERGQALRSMGRFDDAEKAFTRALSLDPRDAISSLGIANVALARGDFAKAESFLKRSIADDAGQAEAELNLGLLYFYKLGRPADARPHFRRFLELAPDDPEARTIRKLAEGKSP